MNSKSAVSFLFFAIFASTTTLACSGADPTAPAAATTTEPAPACTNCGSAAIVADPAPPSLLPVPGVRIDPPIVIQAPDAKDSGAPSADAGTDAADNTPDGSTECTIVEVQTDAGGFEFEVHCP